MLSPRSWTFSVYFSLSERPRFTPMWFTQYVNKLLNNHAHVLFKAWLVMGLGSQGARLHIASYQVTASYHCDSGDWTSKADSSAQQTQFFIHEKWLHPKAVYLVACFPFHCLPNTCDRLSLPSVSQLDLNHVLETNRTTCFVARQAENPSLPARVFDTVKFLYIQMKRTHNSDFSLSSCIIPKSWLRTKVGENMIQSCPA